MRKISIALVLVVLSIGFWNFISLQRNISDVIESDHRNEGVSVFVYFEWFVNPDVVVFDIRDVNSNKSPMDVSRVLFQLSEKLNKNNYRKVILSFRGDSKFMIDGVYFKKIGMEYRTQNPVFILRTLPQNIYNLDGSSAFPTWSGGLIGMLGKQMEDLNDFHKKWYVNELISG